VVCPNVSYFIACQAGVSSIAWGGVGVAKNALIEAVAAHIGYVAHIFIPSQHAPEDIGGIPYHDTTTGFCRMVPMEWMHDLQNPLRWLFIDELTSAQTQMRPPLLSCFNERRVGSLTFHRSTIVSAAANPPELAPNGSPLEPSICNRLYHHEWQFPSGLWHEGLRTGGNFPVPADFPVVGDFAFLLPKWGSLISGLVRNKPTLANTEKVHEGTLAFPTPRSWWNLATCLAAAESVGLLDECRAELGAGIVGTGASAELMARVDAIAMHDVEAILSGTEKVVVTDSSVDRLISLPSAIVMHLDERRKESEVDTAVLDRAVEVMVHLAENDLPDAAVPSLSALKPMFPHYRPSEKLAARYGKVVSAVMGVA
jgi:hypothetical protein